VSGADEYVRFAVSPEELHLRKPLAIVGFGGWIDAGLAASGAVSYLVDEMQAQPLAELDPEPFYAFTDTRPRVTIRGPGEREAHWPKAAWSFVRMPESAERDLLLFSAPEPNLRWRTFTSTVLDVFQRASTDILVSFGAVLAPMHYRAAPGLRGWATTTQLRAALRRRQIRSGNYQGPTGITTVLLTSARERGIAAFSLSTSSPSYLPDLKNPRAAAALLRGVVNVVGVALPLEALERDSHAFLDRVDRYLVDQPELREAVERIGYEPEAAEEEAEPRQASESSESAAEPPELPSSAAVLADLEEFLKNLRRDE
jgi:predicted ATP-grasp superfamily ATP-dependent carboligase